MINYTTISAINLNTCQNSTKADQSKWWSFGDMLPYFPLKHAFESLEHYDPWVKMMDNYLFYQQGYYH